MPRTIDVSKIKHSAIGELDLMRKRIEDVRAKLDYLTLRWMCKMTAVNAHEIWERFVEDRLVAAINHDPKHFLAEQNVKGVKHVSYGLARYIVRGGNRYFDFRSTGDLIARADKWLAPTQNVFKKIPNNDRDYLDALAAIRNFSVHGSDAAQIAYKRELRRTYGIHYAPQPDEFLHALDNRAGSPARYKLRLYGLMEILNRTITLS